MWKRMVLSMLLACLPWSFCHGESPVPEDMGNLEKAGAALEKQEEKVPWFEIHAITAGSTEMAVFAESPRHLKAGPGRGRMRR